MMESPVGKWWAAREELIKEGEERARGETKIAEQHEMKKREEADLHQFSSEHLFLLWEQLDTAGSG